MYHDIVYLKFGRLQNHTSDENIGEMTILEKFLGNVSL